MGSGPENQINGQTNNYLGELDDLDDYDTDTDTGGNNLMADSGTSTQYERKLLKVEEIPARDELVQGSPKACVIKITAAGDYKRGLLMAESSTDGEYQPATAANTKNKDCVILADSIILESGEYTEIAAYYEGRFKASSIILAYEAEGGSHDELISAIANNLRKQNIEVI